jgi:2-polyprenyl-3-methyl-5-hydroxy-6-metoxy-1,4-benzoquinol methylase
MSHYRQHAKSLFAKYRQMDSDILHRDWIQHLPEQPGLACDIGAGSGRDANWLAGQGWDVIAVEPEAEFRRLAQAQSHPNVAWLEDRLPELNQLRRLNQRFNLILLSAVWMHVPPPQRERAFRILSNLLAPGGLLVISLRHGSDEAENQARGFHPVNVAELEGLCRQRALSVVSVTDKADNQGRAHVRWQTVVMQLPDDGTRSSEVPDSPAAFPD